MPENPGVQISAAKAWDFARTGLSMLVIPLLLWGVKLEVGNAERDLTISQHEKENVRLESLIKENSDIEDKVMDLALKQATFEGKLDTALGRMDEIKSLIRARP